MCLQFARQCLRLDKMKACFPRNQENHAIKFFRGSEFYKVFKAQTERFIKLLRLKDPDHTQGHV